MAPSVIHVAGPFDERAGRQVCSRCGLVLISESGPVVGWEEGSEILIPSDRPYQVLVSLLDPERDRSDERPCRVVETLEHGPTFVIVRGEWEGIHGIKCLRCGRTSWHPKDVEHRYCAHCGRFHQEVS